MKHLRDPLHKGVSGLSREQRRRTAHLQEQRTNLLLNVVQRVGRVDGEANQDDVRVGVGEGTEAVVVFLASRIP